MRAGQFGVVGNLGEKRRKNRAVLRKTAAVAGDLGSGTGGTTQSETRLSRVPYSWIRVVWTCFIINIPSTASLIHRLDHDCCEDSWRQRGESSVRSNGGNIKRGRAIVLPTVVAMLTDEHLAFPQYLTRQRWRFYSTEWNKGQFSSSFMLFSVSFWVLHLHSYDRHGLRSSSGEEKALQLHGTEVPSADAHLCFLLWENALVKRVIKLRWLFFNGHQ